MNDGLKQRHEGRDEKARVYESCGRPDAPVEPDCLHVAGVRAALDVLPITQKGVTRAGECFRASAMTRRLNRMIAVAAGWVKAKMTRTQVLSHKRVTHGRMATQSAAFPL